MSPEVIVVGAGVAGLQCARRLQAEGRQVTVIDKARGVGGRCATRRIDGVPVDFGVLFLHGHDPRFLAAVDEMEPGSRVEGWPLRIRDTGTPCQPEAFAPYERRVALRSGMTAFPKHLARDLDVRLETRVTGLRVDGAGFVLTFASGEEATSSSVILAQPLEQAAELLSELGGEETEAALAVISLFASLPCLTVIAAYPANVPAIQWDLCYPSDSACLMLIANESSKRDTGGRTVLVYQARPHWSRQRLEAPAEEWQRELLAAAAERLGDWARRPALSHGHRWRYGRIDQGTELASPMLLRYPGGARLGLTGDAFAPGGGVQASWLAGDRLADRLQREK